MNRPVLRASAPDVCDIRIAWVRKGWIKGLAGDVRYVQTSIPADAVALSVRNMGRSLGASMVAAEACRARLAFGLPR